MSLIGNFSEHPTDNRYTVFTFNRTDQYSHFKESLQKSNIWFAEDIDELENRIKYFVAVKNKDLSVVRRLNYISIGTYRDPIISNKYYRYALILIPIGFVILALIGYFKSTLN